MKSHKDTTPDQEFLKTWIGFREAAEREKKSFKPVTTMKEFAAPEGYTAELCRERNEITGATVARALIICKATDRIQFDYGKWGTPSAVHKKLTEALAALSEVVKRRNAVKEKP